MGGTGTSKPLEAEAEMGFATTKENSLTARVEIGLDHTLLLTRTRRPHVRWILAIGRRCFILGNNLAIVSASSLKVFYIHY